MGLIPGLQKWLNIPKSINVIHHISICSILKIFTSLKYFLYLQDDEIFSTGLPEGFTFLFWIVCSISPYFSMSSISDYKVREGGKKRNFKDSSNCALKTMCSKCFPVRKAYKHMFNLDSTVKHYFYQVRNFASNNRKYFLLQNYRTNAVNFTGTQINLNF